MIYLATATVIIERVSFNSVRCFKLDGLLSKEQNGDITSKSHRVVTQPVRYWVGVLTGILYCGRINWLLA
jgi:hypothetical protein